jgi:hypothetical protein
MYSDPPPPLRSFAVGDTPFVRVLVKNVAAVSVELFELDTFELASAATSADTPPPLQGMVPKVRLMREYSLPPAVLHEETFALPDASGRGGSPPPSSSPPPPQAATSSWYPGPPCAASPHCPSARLSP